MQIEVIEYSTNEVVKTIECHGKSERQVDRVDDGLNRQLNHEEFFTRIVANCPRSDEK